MESMNLKYTVILRMNILLTGHVILVIHCLLQVPILLKKSDIKMCIIAYVSVISKAMWGKIRYPLCIFTA